ncbi:MAG: helix-turn-helix domain-containing protein, partial [Lacipirellulaceae bacterium]
MAEQRFVKFEDAVEKLGVSADKLNELRESGVLRAYRDGGSWKFRGDEIEKMVSDGVPEMPPPSDIGLNPSAALETLDDDFPSIDEDDDDLKLADEADSLVEPSTPKSEPAESELELSLADDDDLSLADSGLDLDTGDLGEPKKETKAEKPPAEESALELAELEDVDAAEMSDVMLDEDDPDATDPADSILLSEEEHGESVPAPASTIIGKDELGLEDADLELATDDDAKEGSELELSSDSGASDVLSSGIAGSGVLDELTAESGGTSAFEDLEELELDLEAESSRIL